jgi:predicted kinase
MFHIIWFVTMKYSLKRLWLSAAAILAVSAPLFLASCSSSDLATSPTLNSNDDVAAALLTSNQPIEQWQSQDNDALPLNPPTDPRGGSGGNGDDPSKPGRSMRPLPLPCLGLTPEQIEQIRQFQAQLEAANQAAMATIQDQLDALRQQEQAAWEAFRQATAEQRQQLNELYQQFRQQVAAIRQAVREGTMTREEARAALRQLAQDFNAQRKAIIDSTADARAQLKAALDSIAQQRKALIETIQPQLDANYQQFLRQVASILTPEQLVIWQRWLNGEDPCKTGRGPRG